MKGSTGYDLRRFLPTLLAGLFLFVALSAVGQEPKQEEKEAVTVGVLGDWPPFYTVNEKGEPTGFGVESFKAIARHANLVPRYRTYKTFPLLRQAAESGEVDVIPNFGIVEGRDVLYTRPVHAFSIAFFVRDSMPGSPGPGEVSGGIGVVETNIGVSLVKEYAGPERTTVYGSVRDAVLGLLAGEVEGLIYPESVVWSLVKQTGLDYRLKKAGPTLAEVKRAVAVTSGRPDLRDRLDRAVAEFLGTPEYERLHAKWLSPPPPYWTARRIGAVAIAALLLLSLIFAGWRYVERRKAKQKLRRSEEKYRDLFQSIRDAILVTDTDRTIVDLNSIFTDLFGYERAEIVGRNTRILYAEEEEFEATGRAFDEHLNDPGFVTTVTCRKKDGTTFPAEGTAFYRRNEAGEVIGFLSIIRDVTERLKLQEQLAQSRKLESIGRLAGGVAHDFNNMLTVIQGHTELLLFEQAEGDPQYADLIAIQRAAERSARLTEQLLAFARKQRITPEVLNLNETVSGMLGMLRRLVGEDVTLDWEPCDDPWPIYMDGSQIDQILANLVVNAEDATGPGGTITIETARATVESEFANIHPDYRPGEYMLLVVSDDGCGMSPETRSRLFEPFFTTKPQGEGTGLGLATVYGIVRQNDGFVLVYSEKGEGTTFKIHLPRYEGEESEREATGEEEFPRGDSEIILLVEDERRVLHLTAQMLKRLGYKVISADTPGKALRQYADHRDAIDLLMTDVVMPEMHGRALAARIRETNPTLPVLYVSGYTANVLAKRGVDDQESIHLLEKPFTTAELAKKTREALTVKRP